MASDDVDTSASLLMRIRNRADDEAWTTFINVYSPLVRRYCVRKGLQVADAADVSQEVMSRVAKSIQSFEYSQRQGRFRSWLGTIIANEIATHLVRQSRGPMPTALLADLRQSDHVWDEEFTEYILALAIDRVRGEFEPVSWAAFEATWLHEQEPAEVAATLGIAVHAVYVNKSRVMKRLESEILLLAEDAPQPPN